MASSQAGKRAPALSVDSIMASTTGYRSILLLLLLGILLPSVLVSGQSTTASPSSASPSAASTMTSATQTTGSATTMQTVSNSQSTTSGGGMASTTQSTTQSTKITGTTMASALTTIQTATTPMSTPSAGSMTTAQSSTTNPSSPVTSGSASNMVTSQSSSSTGMSGMGTTNMYTSTMGMINCPSFFCYYSDCYSMYMSQNTTTCAPGACCELIRQTNMSYTVGCSSSCSSSCVNASQTNCSVNCCNSTGCLNGSFASMMMTTTAMPTTKIDTTTPMATTAARPQTTANKGNKCLKGTCKGTDCYKNFGDTETCSSSQLHCQLKKEAVDFTFKWTAGCTTNCSTQTPCEKETKPPCHLECCNATTTSCLFKNGTMNVPELPNVATRGPHLNTEMIAYFLCLLAVALLH